MIYIYKDINISPLRYFDRDCWIYDVNISQYAFMLDKLVKKYDVYYEEKKIVDIVQYPGQILLFTRRSTNTIDNYVFCGGHQINLLVKQKYCDIELVDWRIVSYD